MTNWRDIQEQAEAFSLTYQDAKDEDKDKQPFWKDLLQIYGVDPRQVGSFEERVRIHGRPGVGKIDYFAPKKFIIEHKTRGKSLDEAYRQAIDYFDALPKNEMPRYIIVSDFARFRVYDLDPLASNREIEFTLEDLSKHVATFAFFIDEEVRVYKPEEPIDVKAVRAIGKLHSALRASNYTPEHISPLLTRIVFCCFADDTGIFEHNLLLRYLEEHTNPEGTDIGAHLGQIFEILNTPEDKRQTNIHPALENLPYVNGGLFAERLNAVFANRDIRDTLLRCMEFDWSKVSPAIFGSMFQSVMDEKERHELGAHYTSEENILKVIRGLFLEDLENELALAKSSKEKLLALQNKLASITLLDPACGCGNFLVVAYRELRRIENEIIARLYQKDTGKVGALHTALPLDVDISKISKLSVEHMYGIEIDAFPAEVAKLSLWLMDHKMNMELGALFGKPLRKLPLTEAPHIVQGNALLLDWESVVPKEKLTYILGNPPFLGYKQQEASQKESMAFVCGEIEGTGVLDFVAGWYIKAARFIQNTTIEVGFVSTNSITQGEQVTALWRPMVSEFGIHINFAHRTFKWTNEATGKAAVYCVIIGFSTHKAERPALYVYDDIRGIGTRKLVQSINPYLVDAPTIFIDKASVPISQSAPRMVYGNEPREGGMLLLTPEERTMVIAKYPILKDWIRDFVSADNFLNGTKRYCYWLVGAPMEILNVPPVRERLMAVRTYRELSKQKAAHEAANTPAVFVSIRQSDRPYLLIPIVSSESRRYIPFGYMEPSVITSNANFMLPDATHYHFGILESQMHMTWVRAVAGRLKSDYRYSNTIVYNNFPWPEKVNEEEKRKVEESAQAVLDARAKYSDATLAHLYNPNTMPEVLLKAHKSLDKAVDACYGHVKGFSSEEERLEFLFIRYQQLAANVAKKKFKK